MKNLSIFIFMSSFFKNSQIKDALLVGSLIAVVSGIFGVFILLRKQTFAGHAIADFGGAGSAIAFLFGFNSLFGFLFLGVLSSIGVELLGDQTHEHDTSTGIVLSLALGVETLFLFLDTHYTGHASAPMLILFGSIFIIKSSIIPLIILLTMISLIIFLIILRPLLLSTINPDLAKIKGLPLKVIGVIFAILFAIIVGESSIVIGTLLSTALLIGPASSAIQLTRRIDHAMLISVFIGITSVWIGIFLAYDSHFWFASHKNWPVSFFVCTLILMFYLLSRFIVFTKSYKLKRKEEN